MVPVQWRWREGGDTTRHGSAFSTPRGGASSNLLGGGEGYTHNHNTHGTTTASGLVCDGDQLWGWPMEVLYQKYHIVIALDMSRSVFEVSRNGVAFFDRIPLAVNSILQSLRWTLETRRKEVEEMLAWVAAQQLPEQAIRNIKEMLWLPQLEVSIVMVNTPQRPRLMLPHQGARGRDWRLNSSDQLSSGFEEDNNDNISGGAAVGSGQDVPGLNDGGGGPVTSPFAGNKIVGSSRGGEGVQCAGGAAHTSGVAPAFLFPLSACPFGALNDSSDYSTERTVPLVTCHDLKQLLDDVTFPARLEATLREFEDTHRADLSRAEMEVSDWPNSGIAETIERVLRFVPFDSSACHSVAIISNFAVNGCSETISFLESQVLRKNVILSCFSLNRFVPWDSPHLTPLGHFLIACGGFGIHVDQWEQLSDENLTREWCQRFEGSRCLAQQLLVHLIAKFPVVAPGISQRLHTLIPSIQSHPYLIESNQTELLCSRSNQKGGSGGPSVSSGTDYILNTHSTLQALRVLAEARVNEGWSVVVDHHPNASASHLYARLDHFLHKGSLTVYLEVDIVLPVMYRRLRVQGTPALVRHFNAIRLDDRISSLSNQGTKAWHSYLVLLRGMLDSWMRADEDLLSLYGCTALSPSPYTAIHAASKLQGCTAEWFNRCSVHSASLFAVVPHPHEKLFCEATHQPLKSAKHQSVQQREGVLSHVFEAIARSLTNPKGLGFMCMQDPPSSTRGGSSSSTLAKGITFIRAMRDPADDDPYCFQWVDVVQVFAVDESTSYNDLIAATFEARFSFYCRKPDQYRSLMDDILTHLSHEFELMHNTKGGAPCRAFVETSTSLETTCVARRALCMGRHDLISQWSDGSSTASGAQSASQGGAGSRLAAARRTKIAAKQTVHHVSQRVFVLGAHGSELFFMNSAASTRWCFSIYLPRTTHLAVTGIGLMLIRRMECAFQLLYGHSGGRRALFRKRVSVYINTADSPPSTPAQGHEHPLYTLLTMCTVHDVVEVDIGESRLDFSIVRHVNHFDKLYTYRDVAFVKTGPQGSPLCVPIMEYLNKDIQEDHALLCSMASSCNMLMGKLHDGPPKASVAYSPDAVSPVVLPLHFQQMGGLRSIEMTLAAVIPHLRDRHVKVLEFQPPSVAGAAGSWELDRGLHYFAGALSDDAVTVPHTWLHASVVRALLGSDASGPVSIQIARLDPRHSSLPVHTFVMTVLPSVRPNSSHPCRVAVGSLDTSAFVYSLCESMDITPPRDILDVCGNRVHVQPTAITVDAVLVASISSCLNAFAAMINARSIHRDMLFRTRRQPSAPSTPNQAHAPFFEWQLGSSPISLNCPSWQMPRIDSVDVCLQDAASPLHNAHGSNNHAATLGEFEQVYGAHMMTYSNTADISFVGVMQDWIGEHKDQPRADDDVNSMDGVNMYEVNRVVEAAVMQQGHLLRRIPCCTSPTFFFDPWHAKRLSHQQLQSELSNEDEMAEESWEMASSESRETTGEVQELGSLECEQIPCVIKLLLSSSADAPETQQDSAARVSSSRWLDARPLSAMASASTSYETPASPRRSTSGSSNITSVRLTLLVRTLPDVLFDVSRNRYRPPARLVRRLLSEAIIGHGVIPIERGLVKAAADFSRPSSLDDHWDDHFFSVCAADFKETELQLHTKPLSRIPEVCSVALEAMMDAVHTAIIDATLQRCAASVPFQRVRDVLVQESKPQSPSSTVTANAINDLPLSAPLGASLSSSRTGADSIPSPRGTNRSGDTNLSNAPTTTVIPGISPSSLLMHSRTSTIQRLQELGDDTLRSLVHRVVMPALRLGKNSYVEEEFSVEFTRTARHDGTVNAQEATQRVFSLSLKDDGVCLIPLGSQTFFVVPPARIHQNEMVLVTLSDGAAVWERVCIFCFSPRSSFPSKEVCSEIKQRISQKVIQVSQVHLLKELRDRQNASDELIPQHWGDQFATHIPENLQAGLRNATFLCQGMTVSEIPLYYKLQHQTKKMFSRIMTNCVKLELLPIYNREQCFVVADDKEHDMFHFLRLVFVKQLAGKSLPSANQFPPLINQNDRCQVLAVQLYSTIARPSIQGVLHKLQDFCYLLALQELQSHLSFVQRKELHSDDWTFLRYERREPMVIEPATEGKPWHPQIRDLFKWFLLRNMQESKFKLIATREELVTMNLPGSFLAHYQLHRGGESTSDLSPNDTDAAPSPPTLHSPNHSNPSASTASSGEIRLIKLVEGPTDVLLSCGITFQTTEGNNIVIDVFSTKLPVEGRTTALETLSMMTRSLQQCVNDSLIQVRFFTTCQRTNPAASSTPKSRPLHVKNTMSVMEDIFALAEQASLPDVSALKRRVFDLRHLSVALLGSLLERLTGLLQVLKPFVFTPNARGTLDVLPGFPFRWLEKLQNNIHVDHEHYFIVCGFNLIDDPVHTDGRALLAQHSSGGNDSPLLAPASHGAAGTSPTLYVPVRGTRAHPATHPSYPFALTTCVEAVRGPLDATAHPELCGLYDSPKLIFRVNAREGIECVVFNLKDSDQIIGLVGHIVAESLKKSNLHRDVLLQSMGFDIPSTFNEQTLARLCCGDARNIHEHHALHIEGETLHRAPTMSRMAPVTPPTPTVDSGSPMENHSLPLEGSEGDKTIRSPKFSSHASRAFSIIISGLASRGLMVNYVFPFDAAVKVLYDDGCGTWETAEECKRCVERLITDSVFVRDTSPLFALQQNTVSHSFLYMSQAEPVRNFRVSDAYAPLVPRDAMVISVYHRHLQRAHILVEAKNARAKVSEGLTKFCRVWRTRTSSPPAALVRHIIQLQLKSKQVYGSRVPEFSLRNEDIGPEDMILDQNIPLMMRRDRDFCLPVDRILNQYVQYLITVLPSTHVIKVDPASPEFANDPDIASRLRCRYGKVHTIDGELVTFTPHLYFAVISIADAIAALRTTMHTGSVGDGAAPSHSRSGSPPPAPQSENNIHSSSKEQASSNQGFFVIEIGFQVVNYALDFFVIVPGGGNGNGSTTVGGVDINIAGTLVKQRFLFSSVLYDLAVRRLMECVKQFSKVLPGQQPLCVALKNLVKYYPSPPSLSLNHIHAFAVTDPDLLELQQIAMRPGNEASRVHFAVPESGVLRRESTQELYDYAGVLVWDERPLMYVMLSTEREAQTCSRVGSRDLHPMLCEARVALTRFLVRSTISLRIDAAWDKLGILSSSLRREDFQLVSQYSVKTAQREGLSELTQHTNGDTSLGSGLALVTVGDIIRQVGVAQRTFASPMALHVLPLHEGQEVLIIARQQLNTNEDLAVAVPRVCAVLHMSIASTTNNNGSNGDCCKLDLFALHHSADMSRSASNSGDDGDEFWEESIAEHRFIAVECLLRIVAAATWSSMLIGIS